MKAITQILVFLGGAAMSALLFLSPMALWTVCHEEAHASTPFEASDGDSADIRLFVYYDTYGTPLFRMYAESIYDAFDCVDKSILNSDNYDYIFAAMINAFSLSGPEDVNVIVLQAHGHSDGDVCLYSDPENTALCSPKAFRRICDTLPGRTVIITGQCYGSEFAEKFWSEGYGEDYAASHYAIYAVSGNTIGYAGQSEVFLFPFGKRPWLDCKEDRQRFGSDGYRLIVSPIDADSDGLVSVRELYDYSSALQFRFAQFSSLERSRFLDDESLGYSYPVLYGSECLDLPVSQLRASGAK